MITTKTYTLNLGGQWRSLNAAERRFAEHVSGGAFEIKDGAAVCRYTGREMFAMWPEDFAVLRGLVRRGLVVMDER